MWRLQAVAARRDLAVTDSGDGPGYIAVMRTVLLITLLVSLLGGCETVQLKAKGGSDTGIDWGVGIRF